MKISVKEASGLHFSIPVPNAMLFSPTLLKYLLRFSSHYTSNIPNIPPQVIDDFCAAVKTVKHKHGTWELIYVESAGGDIVSITL